MTKITVSFYGHGIDVDGGQSCEYIVDTSAKTVTPKTDRRFAWICPTGNSNIDALPEIDDGTNGIVIQQEGKCLALAAAIYAVQRDGRGGPPASIKLTFEEGYEPASLLTGKPWPLLALNHMADKFRQKFVHNGTLQKSNNGAFDDVCLGIVNSTNFNSIGFIAFDRVREDEDSPLSVEAPKIQRNTYKTAYAVNAPAPDPHGPKTGLLTHNEKIVETAHSLYRDFVNGKIARPIVVVSDHVSRLLAERVKIIQNYKGQTINIGPEPTEQATVAPPQDTVGQGAPAVTERAAPEALNFAQAAEVMTADKRYAIIMEHLTELAKASKDRGPDGAAAREKLVDLTRFFAGGIAVLKAQGPNK